MHGNVFCPIPAWNTIIQCYNIYQNAYSENALHGNKQSNILNNFEAKQKAKLLLDKTITEDRK